MSKFSNPPIINIAIHHTAVSRASGKNQLNGVNKYHKGKWNMKSTLGWFAAYNRFVDVDGSRTKCRAIGEETIANVGNNCDVLERCTTVSVCTAGDFNNELLNDKQIAGLRAEIEELQALYPNAKLVFHKDIQPNRTCAGKLFTKDYLHNRILKEVVVEPDPEDKEKAEKIAELMQKITLLEKIVALLLKIKALSKK